MTPLPLEQGMIHEIGWPTVLLVWTLTGGLAAVHLFTPGVTVLESLPRPPVLSFGSGVSVAYVFVHLLPEVSEARDHALPGGEASLLPAELPAFLFALTGFVAFYGLEHAARNAGSTTGGNAAENAGGVFWLHVGSFALYNVLLSYLLVERAVQDRTGVVVFALAIGFHMLVNDSGLRDHFEQRYHRFGRWLLAGTVGAGTVLGLYVQVHGAVLGALIAFLAGSIVLNVVKEELPDDRQNRFPAFAAGAALYTALLLAV